MLLSPSRPLTTATSRRRPVVVTAAPSIPPRAWPATTAALVRASTPLYVLLTAPQLWHNAAVLASGGDRSLLSALSPAGFGAAAVGNAALLAHFIDTDESGAALVQAIGLASNALVVTQLAADPGVRAGVVAAAAAVAAAATARASRALPPPAWALVKQALALACACAFAVAAAAAAGADARAGLAGAGGAAYVATHVQLAASPSTAAAAAANPPLAWGATLLFAIQPVAALAAALAAGPARTAAGLAAPSLLLAATANALCFPRAVHVRDTAWAAGTAWGAAGGLALAAVAAAGGGVPPVVVGAVAAAVAGLWAAAVGREREWRLGA